MNAIPKAFLWTVCAAASVGTAWSQAAKVTQHPAFEVASVRENKSDEKPSSNFPLNPGPQYADTGGVLIGRNILLLQYVVFAYKPSSWQIQGLRQGMPEWTRSARYDIEAKAAGPATKDGMRAMMRTLLEERFGMRVHTVSRESNVFALEVAKPGKLGPKLRLHPADDPDCKRVPLAEGTAGGYPHACGTGAMMAASGPGLFAAGGQNVTMDNFVLGLTDPNTRIDRPVLNRTGLEGGYDFTLEWASGSSDPAAPVSDAGPDMVEALREQMGLKLMPEKAQVEFLVVDKVERPTPN
jgi:uncharacterized protein (TIGR03435 family)